MDDRAQRINDIMKRARKEHDATTAASYAEAVVRTLAEHFPGLADPMTAGIIKAAVTDQATSPRDTFEVIVDDPRRADWRLKGRPGGSPPGTAHLLPPDRTRPGRAAPIRRERRPDCPGDDTLNTDDQVARLKHIQATHPGWQIISPRDIRSTTRGILDWRALSPSNELIQERELRDLLDQIERTDGNTP